MPLNPQAEVGYNWRDTQIAFGRALGMTLTDIGKIVQTDEHPAGVTDRTVTNRLGRNKAFIEQQIQWFVTTLRQHKVEQVEQVTAKTVKSRIDALLGNALEGLEFALRSGDTAKVLDAAKFVIEQSAGKARQTNVNLLGGKVEHVHFHEAPRQLVAAVDQLIGAGTVPALLPGEVIEAELVDEQPV